MRFVSLIPLLILCLAAMVVPAGASDPMVDRPWPVEAPPAVSSSFCEYREGHLHAGIDVRTYGREGIPCIAAGDGYVSRVRAAATGYGKVVYLQLDSGETLVYAHLSQFTAVVDSMVVAHQKRFGRYRVDFRPTPNRIRVREGEVIAWSGSTGGVDPHLHFEIRNRREHPLDPFAHGFALHDTLRPAIERVAFVPLAVGDMIDGACFPLQRTVREVGPGSYVVDDTVSVTGRVGLQVKAIDYLNADSGRLAPRSIEVQVDGRLVTRMEFESFDFTQASDVDFVYDVGRIRLYREYWYQLYQRSGRTMPGFEGTGWIASGGSGGLSEVRVLVSDVAGNQSELNLVVRDGIGARSRAALDYRAGEIPGLYILEDLVSFHRGAGIEWIDAPDEAFRPAGMVSDRLGHATGANSAAIHDRPVSLRAGERIVHLRAALPGELQSLDFPALDFELGIGDRTAYAEQVFYVTAWDGDPRNQQALYPRCRAVQIGPFSMTLRADMTLRFDVSELDSTDAIYRRAERSGKWVYYPSEIDSDMLTTTAKRPGVYTVLRDFSAPRITRPQVARRFIHATGQTRPEIQIRIEDDGSGVDYRRCAVFLDGIEQIARWDGRLKKLFVLIRDENIMGTQAMTVVAYDNVGHRTQLDVHVDISRRK